MPCWIETFQPDPRAARAFYGALLGWEFGAPGPMPGGLPGEYAVAHVDGRTVAGIGALAGGPPSAVWNTRVRVEDTREAVARATTAGARLLLGPLDGAGDGSVAVLLDPAGAAFAVWDAPAGAERVNAPRAWMMSALHTPDPAGAGAFYGAVFGWEAEPIAPAAPVTVFRLPGYAGGMPVQAIPRDAVAVMTADVAVPPHWSVNLRVDDADAIAARASELGGTVLVPPLDTPGFRSAVLLDPQGAAFAVSQVLAG